ncbi:glycosyl transferases group 1 family protein [Burkholderia cenocepacia]|uniref:Glycosyl transferases group 1 family protein n=1 Tax=Burkholderia cenocepacia TaxID=95486 RepID=A0AAN0VK73_9BURK|nr:glycosyl transferases group 1 family protein [Burkholderia cenocepacia]
MHLANDVRESGNGIINVLVDLACNQAQSGHDVVVASGGGEYVGLLEQYGVRHIELRQRPIRKAMLPLMVMKFVAVLLRERPDVVHAHMVTGIFLGKIGKAVKSYALISTVHNEFNRSAKYMGFADRVVGVSRAVTEAMVGRSVDPNRMATICNGTVGTPRSRKNDDPTMTSLMLRPSVATVAGLFHRKGIDVLIRAFAESRAIEVGAHLYIIGEGRDRPAFETIVQELEIHDRVHFLGFKKNVMAHLRQTDVFVLASRREPFGLAVLEAREAGCAIIASDVDGIPEALDGGESGVLVPPGDVQALSTELNRLLCDAEALSSARRIASVGIERFSASKMTDDYLELYEVARRQVGKRTSD